MTRLASFYFLSMLAITTARGESALPPEIAGQLTKIDVALQQKPPEVQVQTWTKMARMLMLRYPAVATRYALRAEESSDPRDVYGRARIYEVMLNLDSAAAERISRTIANKDVLFSAAMGHCQELRDVQCGVQTLRKGLVQGGYHITGVAWLLDSLNDTQPKLTQDLFKDIVVHFPDRKPTLEDCQTLLDVARAVAQQNPTGSREAAEKIQAALNRPAFEERQDQVITGKLKIGDAVVPASTTKEYFQIQVDALKTGRTALPIMTNYALKRPPATPATFAQQPDAAIERLLDGLRNQAQGMSDFTLNDLSGRAYKLSALHGKAVLVNFWATWCGPCRAEMPGLETLYRESVPILAITDEESAVVRRFLSKEPYAFPVLLDKSGSVFRQYQVEARPTTLLVDSQGQIVARWNDPPSLEVVRALLRDAQR